MQRALSARVVGLAIVVAAGAGAQAGTGGDAAAPAPAPRCVPAAIADVVLGGPVAVDEIRVVVAEGSPEAGAAEVVVESGRADRVVHVLGGSHDLQFFPAMTASAFRVSLSPVFGAGGDACVDRIELRRGGAPVATVVP
ncbi:MAG TPA: hypothetical protein VMZ28_25595 [Kofleriaceae bacterium]|nr:hypothetical protein [Kofleriaceae bacterium]